MTAPWWFVVAVVLVLCGVLLLALARRRTAAKRPDGDAAARTGGSEGGYTDPPDPSLFEPATDPVPQPPTHWHAPTCPHCGRQHVGTLDAEGRLDMTICDQS